MTDGHRIITNAEDWMRSMERRLSALERRGPGGTLVDRLGHSVRSQARQIVDWNDESTFENGWYFTDIGALNTPNPTLAWIGQTLCARGESGIQQVWSYATGATPTCYVRQFHLNDPPVAPTFTAWALT